MKKKSNNQSAFTMVELIITLLIVGILAALATFTYSEYVKRSRLAEATVLIDALAKSETTHYLTYKRFMSFMVPNSYENILTIPNLGSKLLVDSSYSSCLHCPDKSTAPWEALGKPLADSTGIGFFLAASSGKNDSAGHIVSTPFESTYSSGGFYANIEHPTNPGGIYACVLQVQQNLDFDHTPDKSWTTINAYANFNDDPTDFPTTPTSPGIGACSRVYKYIYTTDTGKISAGGPIVTENFGH